MLMTIDLLINNLCCWRFLHDNKLGSISRINNSVDTVASVSKCIVLKKELFDILNVGIVVIHPRQVSMTLQFCRFIDTHIHNNTNF